MTETTTPAADAAATQPESQADAAMPEAAPPAAVQPAAATQEPPKGEGKKSAAAKKKAKASATEMVHVVMTTSKVFGPEDRQMKRGSVVRVSARLAERWGGKGKCRPAREAEVADAGDDVVKF